MDEVIERYQHGLRKSRIFVTTLIVLTVVFTIVSMCFGSVFFSPIRVVQAILHHYFSLFPDVEFWEDVVITNGRFPRTIMCILTGASLGIAGTMMQGVLRNPLVSPFTLGVSSAATFGAALVVVYGANLALYSLNTTLFGYSIYGSTLMIAVGASVVGILSVGLVFILSKRRISQATVILAGVVIGYLFQAGVTYLKYISDDAALREITNWTMGGMWNITWASVIVCLPVVLICTVILWRLSLDVDSLSSGDDIAKSIGVDVRKVRSRVLIFSTISVATCMGFTGVIGFIGLMAPHISRMIIGNNTQYLFPATAFFGATLLLACDTLGRVIISPGELPAGVIMYLIGGLFFVYLIVRKNTKVM